MAHDFILARIPRLIDSRFIYSSIGFNFLLSIKGISWIYPQAEYLEINAPHSPCLLHKLCAIATIRNILHGKPMKTFNILAKSGVPRPVTGSQPWVALKGSEPHTELFPLVMSLNIQGCL